MSYKTSSDNIYAVNTLITAKKDPSLKLKIVRYYQRTYYCAVVGDESRELLTYFERELIAPPKPGKQQISVDLKVQ